MFSNQIYMSIDITYYGNCRPVCTFVQSVDDGELEAQKLPLDQARKLLWELMLTGAKKEIRVNWYDPHIQTVRAYVFLTH